MEAIKKKLMAYSQALTGLSQLVGRDLKPFESDKVILDGIKNGCIQKFEYCTELTWKMIRKFLIVADGVESASPKGSIKEFYAKGHVDEKHYQQLMKMIDDRNSLSHLYSQDEFDVIFSKIPSYLKAMQSVESIIQKYS